MVLLPGSGTVAAASNSFPDEPLYSVKLATESVQLAMTPSARAKAELYVKFADRRVDEIIEMADQGKVAQVEKATDRMNAHLVAMANLAAPGGEAAGGAAVPAPLLAPAPAPAPAPTPAPTPAPAQVPAPSPAPAPAPSPTPGPSVKQVPPPSVAVPAPGKEERETGAPRAPGQTRKAEPQPATVEKGVKADKKAELKDKLARQAAENQQALQRELEKAPEALRPALERAIEVAGRGYEHALKSLD
ncbi:MAG: hypothetical protein A2137_05610 [Chloroflexi bacterium RBG_16_58_8]|nr:MAG: hypothetical protein A2137_05610 [Chloroflexi bacterium RBG_16_58_8]